MIYLHKSKETYINKYGRILEANGIAFEYIDSQEPDFWVKIKDAELFINYLEMGTAQMLRQNHLISVIDQVLQVPCFPNWATAWHFDDKIAETLLLQSGGYPLIDSWIYWNKEAALTWAKQADYPLVFKLKNGASSINVIKVNDRKHAESLIRKMFGRGIINNRLPGSHLLSIYKKSLRTYLKNELLYWMAKYGIRYSYRGNWNKEHGYVLFQRFIPNNDYDTRIHVIGRSAFALRRKNRPNDFRASGAGKIDFSPEKIYIEMVKISHKITEELGFNSMTFDFLIDESGKPVINEIGCQFADWAPYKFPGYWDRDLIWHEGHFWPQYIQLKYMLKRDDLIQPELRYEHPHGYTFTQF